MIKATRNGTGFYTVRDLRITEDDAYVNVLRNPALRGPDKWIAYSGWDHHCVTDPLPTKHAAVLQAAGMLADLAPALCYCVKCPAHNPHALEICGLKVPRSCSCPACSHRRDHE